MPPVPTDGRMTSFTAVPATLGGTELMWIVQPGNAQFGVLYNVTLDVLAGFFGSFPLTNTITITSGATLGVPYDVPATATRILFDKTVASASYAVLPLASALTYPVGITFKDLKGDASTNVITLTFTGGQLCDGLDTITIASSYGWVTLYPTPDGSAWYMGP